MLAKYKVNELTMPHDMRFPFVVIYNWKENLKDEVLCLMLLWAQNDEIRQEWIDAFNYIKVAVDPEFEKTIDERLKLNQMNFFSIIMYKCLE